MLEVSGARLPAVRHLLGFTAPIQTAVWGWGSTPKATALCSGDWKSEVWVRGQGAPAWSAVVTSTVSLKAERTQSFSLGH